MVLLQDYSTNDFGSTVSLNYSSRTRAYWALIVPSFRRSVKMGKSVARCTDGFMKHLTTKIHRLHGVMVQAYPCYFTAMVDWWIVQSTIAWSSNGRRLIDSLSISSAPQT